MYYKELKMSLSVNHVVNAFEKFLSSLSRNRFLVTLKVNKYKSFFLPNISYHNQNETFNLKMYL